MASFCQWQALTELNRRIIESKGKLGEVMIVAIDQNDDEQEIIPTGSKRKGKSRKEDKRNKRRFLDSSAAVDDEDESEDEESDSEEESDIEGLINDNSDEEENDVHFYRLLDRQRRNNEEEEQPVMSETETESNVEMTPEEQILTEKWLKKFERVLKRLNKYINQHTVLGFNSQKYDVPLIPYLPSSLMKKEGNNPE